MGGFSSHTLSLLIFQVGINYRESEWAADEVAPYQIRLDDGEGTLIFAPMDDDRVVRKLV